MTTSETKSAGGAPDRVAAELDRMGVSVGRVLRGGVVVGALLMLLGLALHLRHGDAPRMMIGHAPSVGALLHGDGEALLQLGLLLLIATPVVRMVLVAWHFARARAWWLATAALGVLVIILTSVLLKLR